MLRYVCSIIQQRIPPDCWSRAGASPERKATQQASTSGADVFRVFFSSQPPPHCLTIMLSRLCSVNGLAHLRGSAISPWHAHQPQCVHHRCAAAFQHSMAALVMRRRRHPSLTLLCAVLAVVAAQSCAAAGHHKSATRPHASKRPHHPPHHPPTWKGVRAKQPHVRPHTKPHANPPRKTAPVRVHPPHKPAGKPAVERRSGAAARQAAAVEQVTVRNCGTPAQNQTARVAVHSLLQRRMDQRAQGRAAPITVRVFFAIIQASRIPDVPHWFQARAGSAGTLTSCLWLARTLLM